MGDTPWQGTLEPGQDRIPPWPGQDRVPPFQPRQVPPSQARIGYPLWPGQDGVPPTPARSDGVPPPPDPPVR